MGKVRGGWAVLGGGGAEGWRGARWEGDLIEVDLVGETHGLGLDLQDGQAAGVVGDAEVHLAVEAAEAAERGVDDRRPVGRRDHLSRGGWEARWEERWEARQEARCHGGLVGWQAAQWGGGVGKHACKCRRVQGRCVIGV